MKIKITITLFLMGIICPVFAQNNFTPQVKDFTTPSNILSPEASGLGRFGDIPVSYYTGAPDISIPLYTLTGGGLPLPITLSYDASGVRVNDHPSWVGQNWTLSAGGVITRSVQDNPDEGSLWPRKTSPNADYFWNSSVINDYNFLNADLNFLHKNLDPYIHYVDMQPDIFCFNFMGKTGKFFMGNDGEWKVQSEHNLEIICDASTELSSPFIKTLNHGSRSKYEYPFTLTGFKIKDDNGNTYVFGHNPDAIEYSIDFYRQYYFINGGTPDTWTANAWYLTKVIDKYSNTVYELTYERGKFTAALYHSLNSNRLTTDFNMLWIFGNVTTCNISEYSGLGGSLISPVYLKEINDKMDHVKAKFASKDSFEKIYAEEVKKDSNPYSINAKYLITSETPNFFCYLYPSPQMKDVVSPYIDKEDGTNPLNGLRWRKLNQIYICPDEVKLEDGGDYIKGYAGDYYLKEFWFQSNDVSDQRLRLDKLIVYDNHPALISRNYNYSFTYDNFEALPTNYVSKETDHWGYYNGKGHKLNQAYTEESIYQCKEPDYTLSQYGILTGITYPTQGTTTFEYEPHDYSYVVSRDKQSLISEQGRASGLRIKRIINNNGAKEEIRTFKYLNADGTSSGILSARPQYVWNNWQAQAVDNSGTVKMDNISLSSLIPLSNSFGSHIGYNRVIEESEGNGYTVYEYSNYDTVKDQLPTRRFQKSDPSSFVLSPYDKFNDMGHRRGKLLSQKVYAQNKELQKEIIFTYRTDTPENTKFSYASNFKVVYGDDNTDMAKYSRGVFYKIFYPQYDLVKETTKNYYGNNVVVSEIAYTKRDKQLNINNRKVDIRILDKITFNSMDKIEYSYPFDLTDNYMSNLTDSFRISNPVIVKQFRNSTPRGYEKFEYQKLGNLILPYRHLVSERGAEKLRVKTIFNEYNTSNGKLLRYTTQDSVSHVILWGYKNSKPVLLVDNAPSFSSVITYGTYFGNTTLNIGTMNEKAQFLRSHFPNMMVNNYTYYYNYGVTTETAPNGYTNHYIYDRNGRLNSILDNERNVEALFEYNYIRSSPPLRSGEIPTSVDTDNSQSY